MKKLLIFLIFIGILLFISFIFYQEGLLAVNTKNASTDIFVIQKGESVNDIISNLYNEGLIRNKISFLILVKQLGIENNIQAGDFRLSPSMSAKEIAKTLTKGTLDKWVTIIEGLRAEQVAQVMSRELGIPEAAFLAEAKEGYLFPDTYLIPRDASASAVLEILERNFNNKFNESLRAQAIKNGLSQQEVITLASMVEREAKTPEAMQTVASIMLKRLKLGIALRVDATVQYALGYQPGTKSWWKSDLTAQDLQTDSAYNTYKRPGLPPAPISNPGLAAITAVINSNPNTPYLYYISSKDGSSMHYARTLEEHEENIRKYLR